LSGIPTLFPSTIRRACARKDIRKKLLALSDVGLDYLTLSQPMNRGSHLDM
jgi:hypothetical protein